MNTQVDEWITGWTGTHLVQVSQVERVVSPGGRWQQSRADFEVQRHGGRHHVLASCLHLPRKITLFQETSQLSRVDVIQDLRGRVWQTENTGKWNRKQRTS